MKKNTWIIGFISIIVITLILTTINHIIYGTEKYIANYMPPMLQEPSWEMVKLTRTIIDMRLSLILSTILTIIESIILYQKQILKKNIHSFLLILIIFIVPILLAGIKLSSIYQFAC